jgi:putative membrane protein
LTLLALLTCSGFCYWLGGRRAAGGSRQRREGRWRAQSFYGGLLALAIATQPPLDRLADELFWAHMLQHLLLQMIAPPLLVLGAPWLPIWRLVPLATRRRLSRWLAHSPRALPVRTGTRFLAAPFVAWLLFIGAISFSHLPTVFDFALRHDAFHEAEHGLFVVVGLLFWSRALDSPPFRSRLAGSQRVVFFLAATAAEWLLALVILAARAPLYSSYRALTPRPEHLSALADQQFGAGIMLDPLSPLTFAILWAAKQWLAPAERPRKNLAPV